MDDVLRLVRRKQGVQDDQITFRGGEGQFAVAGGQDRQEEEYG